MRWLLLAALPVLMPLAAEAQFYDLDGAYRCVTKDACDAVSPATQPAPAPLARTEAPKPEPAAPSLAEAIEHVKHRAPSAADIALITARAQAQEPRAVEVLAWCKLNGLGMSPDPVAAYLLYGEAARLGVATARQNQQAIYETRLDSAERQQVLLKDNTR